MHDIIDNITAHWYAPKRANITLQDICYKPFGSACAIESVAQYWQMDRRKFEAGNPSLEQCLAHWSTQCRRAQRSVLPCNHPIPGRVYPHINHCLHWKCLQGGSRQPQSYVMQRCDLVSLLCRSTFEAPIEPKMVLGGYPEGDSFASFTANTTALLITLPVDAAQHQRIRAKAWELQFLHTVRLFCCICCCCCQRICLQTLSVPVGISSNKSCKPAPRR